MSSRKRQKVSEDGKSRAIEWKQNTEDENAGRYKGTRESSRTLFIRSLPPTTKDEDLIQFFSQSAVVKHAVSVLDKDSKQCKGYGFVTFVDREDAANAQAAFNGASLNGREIQLEVAEPRHRDSQVKDRSEKRFRSLTNQRSDKQQGEPSVGIRPTTLNQLVPRLIVRNLPWSIKDDKQLAQLFTSFGKIKEANLPKSKNGMLKGFGFVLLRGRKNAERAILQLNGKLVDGRNIAVDWSAPKDVWENSQTAEPTWDGQHSENKTAQREEISKDGLASTAYSEYDGSVASPDSSSESSGEAQNDVGDETSENDRSNEVTDSMSERLDESRTEEKSKTIFVRNLPFNVDDAALYEHFRQVGPVRYARVVMDYATDVDGRSRGSGFVCFHRLEDASHCLSGAPKPPSSVDTGGRQYQVQRSVLQNTREDFEGLFTIEGRVLQIDPCIDHDQAQRLEADGRARREKEDKRHLYLLREGSVSNKSPNFNSMSTTEIRMREASFKQRQDLVRQNPSLHLSLTRLAVRNIPRYMNSRELKALARQAVVGFAKDVKEGLRDPLTSEERRRDLMQMPRQKPEHRHKDKGKGIVKQAKIVFETHEGRKIEEQSVVSRSRGYGFIEYTSHRCALMGLRWLNGYLVTQQNISEPGLRKSNSADAPRRLIVEFAIENAQVVKRRQDREERSRFIRDDPLSTRARQNASMDGESTEHDYEATSARGQNKAGRVQDLSLNDKHAIRQQIIGRKRAKRRVRQ